MRDKIHPKYYENAKVSCLCGNTFTLGSTKPEIRVEVCGKCHPFYTGEQRIVDPMGRVERFKKRYKMKQNTFNSLPQLFVSFYLLFLIVAKYKKNERLPLGLPWETRNSLIAATLGDILYIFRHFYHNTLRDFS